MEGAGNKFTGVLVLMASLIIALSGAALFYFFKIEQNETYQNQLHFRELERYVAVLTQNKQSMEVAFDAYTEKQQKQAEDTKVLKTLADDFKQISLELAGLEKKHQENLVKDNCLHGSCDQKTIDKLGIVKNQHLLMDSQIKSEINRLTEQFFNTDTAKKFSAGCLVVFENTLNRANNLLDCITTFIYNQTIQTPTASVPSNNPEKPDLPKPNEVSNTTQGVNLCHPRHKVCLNRQAGVMQPRRVFDDLTPRTFSTILNSPSQLLPLVLLVDSSGKLIHKGENIKSDATHHGLRFESLKQVLQEFRQIQLTKTHAIANQKQPDGSEPVGYSSYLDLQLAGNDYRLFIQPWSGLAIDQGAEPEMLYLLGLQSRSAFMSEKLAVSNSIVLIFTLLLIAFIALIPLLKVRLVSSQQGFNRGDVKVIPLALAIFAVLVSLSWFQLSFYQGLKISLDQVAQAAFKEIQSSFQQELTAWKSIAEAQLDRWKQDKTAGEALMKISESQQSLLEGVYLIDRNRLMVDGFGALAHPRQYRPGPYSISTRDYVQQAKNCSGWLWFEASEASSCTERFYVERLRNKLDMRLNTWVGVPRFHNRFQYNQDSTHPDQSTNNTQNDTSSSPDQNLLIFGGQLKTFYNSVMPKDYRFLVFDNQSGEVLYHSDEWLSKIDNIFADTDNDAHLNNLVKIGSAEPVMLDTRYKGKDTIFQVGAIANNLPWTLVVMYDKNPYRLLNLLSAFSSWSMSFLYVLILYAIWRCSPQKLQLRLHQVLWFANGRYAVYRNVGFCLLLNLLFAMTCFYYANDLFWLSLLPPLLIGGWLLWRGLGDKGRDLSSQATASVSKTEPNRETSHPLRAYSLFILLLLLNFTLIPSTLFSTETSSYLLYRNAQIHQHYLAQSVDRNQQQLKQHVAEFFDGQIFDNKDKNTVVGNSRVNCYPGDLFTSLLQDKQSCAALQGNQEKLDPLVVELFNAKQQTPGWVGRWPWLFTTLQLPLFSEIWTLQQTELGVGEQQQSNPSWLGDKQLTRKIVALPAGWSQFLIWAISAAGLLILLLLIRYWLCQRMMGLDRVDNFRINPATQKTENYQTYNALVRILYPYQQSAGKAVYLQLVRPSAATEALINMQNWTQVSATSQAPDCLLRGLTPLNVADLQLPVAEQYLSRQSDTQLPTLLLNGFELLIWNKQVRKQALAALQQLIAAGQVNLVLLLDMSPLYRLTQPQAYSEHLPQAEQLDAEERQAWVTLFVKFMKIYDWVPNERKHQIVDTATDMLWYEASSWPELWQVAVEFLGYHCAVKDPQLAQQLQVGALNSSAYCKNLRRCTRLYHHLHQRQSLSDKDAKLAGDILISVNRYWSKEQIIDYFNSAAAARYQQKWQLCTIQEKVLLISLQKGDIPNPRNRIPLEHLVRRGYIFYDQGWHLVNVSFGRFLLTAEDPVTVRQWIHATRESLWKYARIPLGIGLLLLLGLLAYTATDSLQSLIALLAAMLGIIPVIFNNLSLFKLPGTSNSA